MTLAQPAGLKQHYVVYSLKLLENHSNDLLRHVTERMALLLQTQRRQLAWYGTIQLWLPAQHPLARRSSFSLGSFLFFLLLQSVVAKELCCRERVPGSRFDIVPHQAIWGRCDSDSGTNSPPVALLPAYCRNNIILKIGKLSRIALNDTVCTVHFLS